MRVIAGQARRTQLKTLEGKDTRPTTDRIKETLFNIIAPGLCDCEFLDLFAGSGAIGIEALSRGAAEAVFVESNPKAMACIKENLARTRLEGQAVTMAADAVSAIHTLSGRKQFDYIFMDPPYDCLLEKQMLASLKDSGLLKDDTVVIVEASKGTDFSYLREMGYAVLKEKEYKTNKHIFVVQEGKYPC